VVTPDVLHEGESRGSTPPSSTEMPRSESISRKRKQEDEININKPQKMQGQCPDYKHMNDSFSEEEEEEESAERL
jgi:hypothetical protein